MQEEEIVSETERKKIKNKDIEQWSCRQKLPRTFMFMDITDIQTFLLYPSVKYFVKSDVIVSYTVEEQWIQNTPELQEKYIDKKKTLLIKFAYKLNTSCAGFTLFPLFTVQSVSF